MKGIDLHKHLPTYVLFYLSFQSLTFLKVEILKQVKAPPTKVCQSETIWKPAPPLSRVAPALKCIFAPVRCFHDRFTIRH